MNTFIRQKQTIRTGTTDIVYTVSQKKNKQNYFCYNYVKLPPKPIIFGKKMANSLKLYEMHSFPPYLIHVNALPC